MLGQRKAIDKFLEEEAKRKQRIDVKVKILSGSVDKKRKEESSVSDSIKSFSSSKKIKDRSD